MSREPVPQSIQWPGGGAGQGSTARLRRQRLSGSLDVAFILSG
jgi:hypothetical protein